MTVAVVELRDFRPADGSLLMSWVRRRVDTVAWAGSGFTWPLDVGQIAAYAAAPERHSWMGFDPRSGQTVGHVSVRLSVGGGVGRLGRVLIAPEVRGRGLATAMLGEALSRAFGDLGLRHVELGVYSHNTSAVRLYERFGFQAERVVQGTQQIEGPDWTLLEMGLAKADWLGRNHDHAPRSPMS